MKKYAVIFFILILLAPPIAFAKSDNNNAENNFHQGTIQWIDKCIIISSGTSIVRVTDHDMNKDPTKIEHFDIEMGSDSDRREKNTTVTETGKDTGIFEGTVFFFTHDDDGSSHRVRISVGDTVFARYVDENPAKYGIDNKPTDNSGMVLVAEIPVLEPLNNKKHTIEYGPCTISYVQTVKKTHSPKLEMLYPAPLKQIESGLSLDEIKCKENLELVPRYDGDPACVKEQSIPKLIERGWVMPTKCHPTMLNSNHAEIYVNLPYVHQILPNYKLQAVDQTGVGIMLYYSDESLCKLRGGPLGEVQSGTVVVEVIPLDSGISNEDWAEYTLQSSLDDAIFYEPQLLFVNDQKAVGWESYYGQSIATMNEEVFHQEDVLWPGRVLFYDEKSHLSYNIMGLQSLKELQKIVMTLLSDKNSEPMFLSKSFSEWKTMSEESVYSNYESYDGDDFYTQLGAFLIKEETKKEMQRQNITNIYEDFVVYPGYVLTSLPPHISFSAVINATDQKTYFVSGGTHANEIKRNEVQIRELVFHPGTLNQSDVFLSNHDYSQRQMPSEKVLDMEPSVNISKGEIYDVFGRYFANADPYHMIQNLDKDSVGISFYNNLDVPIRVQVEYLDEDNSSENTSTKSRKTGTIAPKKTGAIQFDTIGQYEWNVMVPYTFQESFDGSWEIISGGGEITIVSQDTQYLSLEQRIEIARPFIHHAREDIPWTGLGSGHGQYVEIEIPKSIHKMVPNAKEYYEKRAQEWIPFEVPIKIR